MSRRAVSMAVLVVTLVVAALASSSGDAPLWTTTGAKPDVPGGSVDRVEAEDREPSDAVEESDDPAPFPAWLVQVLVVIAGAIVVIGAVLAVGRWRPTTRRVRLARGSTDPLPEVDLPAVDLDADAARAALGDGTPRNGIVACWMQLERDAATAGLPRTEAETSSEYVERVIASSSVDAGPIRDLAALFREARFSDHPLDEQHRVRARALLERVEAALHASQPVP